MHEVIKMLIEDLSDIYLVHRAMHVVQREHSLSYIQNFESKHTVGALFHAHTSVSVIHMILWNIATQ